VLFVNGDYAALGYTFLVVNVFPGPWLLADGGRSAWQPRSKCCTPSFDCDLGPRTCGPSITLSYVPKGKSGEQIACGVIKVMPQ